MMAEKLIKPRNPPKLLIEEFVRLGERHSKIWESMMADRRRS